MSHITEGRSGMFISQRDLISFISQRDQMLFHIRMGIEGIRRSISQRDLVKSWISLFGAITKWVLVVHRVKRR